MTRYFVDVDDTLILWDDRVSNGDFPLSLQTNWKVNEPLAKKIREVMQDEDNELIIWSGGGQGYAQTFAMRAFPDLPWRAFAKDNQIVMPGDVVIDDGLEFKSDGQLMTWRDFCAKQT